MSTEFSLFSPSTWFDSEADKQRDAATDKAQKAGTDAANAVAKEQKDRIAADEAMKAQTAKAISDAKSSVLQQASRDAQTMVSNVQKNMDKVALDLKKDFQAAINNGMGDIRREFAHFASETANKLASVAGQVTALKVEMGARVGGLEKFVHDEIPQIYKRHHQLADRLDNLGLLPTGKIWADMRRGFIQLGEDGPTLRILEPAITLALMKSAVIAPRPVRTGTAAAPTLSLASLISGFVSARDTQIDVDSVYVTPSAEDFEDGLAALGEEIKSTRVTLWPVVTDANGKVSALHASKYVFERVFDGFVKVNGIDDGDGVTDADFNLGNLEDSVIETQKLVAGTKEDLEINPAVGAPEVGEDLGIANAALAWKPRVSYQLSRRAALEMGISLNTLGTVATTVGAAALSKDVRWGASFAALSEKIKSYAGLDVSEDYITKTAGLLFSQRP